MTYQVGERKLDTDKDNLYCLCTRLSTTEASQSEIIQRYSMGGNPHPFRPIADDSNRPFSTKDQCLTRFCIDGADAYICR